jgi:hypothetical protein
MKFQNKRSCSGNKIKGLPLQINIRRLMPSPAAGGNATWTSHSAATLGRAKSGAK